jgi:hypothetical protein
MRKNIFDPLHYDTYSTTDLTAFSRATNYNHGEQQKTGLEIVCTSTQYIFQISLHVQLVFFLNHFDGFPQ